MARCCIGEPSLAGRYDPEAYWLARHEQFKGDIRSVGNKGLSILENESAYRERADAMRWFLTEHLGDLAGRRAIEFGCGIGMVAATLVELGIAYTGVDVSPVALADARRRCRAGRFVRGDIRTFRTKRPYDLAVAAHVLCHMVDDDDWDAVLAALALAVRPSGALLLIDNVPEREAQLYGDYVRHRPLPDMVEGLARHGFRLAGELSRDALHLAWRA
jgi:SAM-dependent methyltransferase